MLRIDRSKAEHIRMQAAKCFAVGSTQADVARLYKVSRTAAMKWHRTWKSGKSLEQRKATGRPRLIGIKEMREFMEIATAAEGRCTSGSIAVAIRRRFGVAYDHDHVGKMLNKMGFRWSGKGWKRE